MKVPFTKMHGTGNDFIVIDCRNFRLADPAAFSVKFCHRKFGVGADQMLLLYPSEIGDFAMKIFNADGSEVEMCGNGIRCFAKYVWDRNLSGKKVLEVETLAGMIRPEKSGNNVRVDMGEPILAPDKIPVAVYSEAMAVDYPLIVEDRNFKLTFVSMGNPHAVIFLEEEVSGFAVDKYGPLIETHALFPKKTNVEFVNVKSRDELIMRVWERGSGETLACGTGACATAVAAMIKGLTEKHVIVKLLGGDLSIEWSENNRVYMTGPAVEVFE
ncbi:MAG TPA: diaminopimelate epimerase, partial [Dissulfurispiraceae bacterium]|nr:diaminopimelate epimerase [Dissulfurispiraceae bacterium]